MDFTEVKSDQASTVLQLATSTPELLTPQDAEHGPEVPDISPVTAIQRRERISRRLLGAADALAYLSATLIAAALSGHSLRWSVGFVPCFAVLIAKIQGLYDRDEMVLAKTSMAEWRRVLPTAALVSIGTYLGWSLLIHDASRIGMRLYIFLTLVGFGLSLSGRWFARRVARRVAPNERCVIVGDVRRSGALALRLSAVPGVQLVGTIATNALTGSIAELRTTVEELDVHRLIIASVGGESDEITLHLIQAAKFIGIRVSILPSVMTAVGGVAAFDDLDGLMLLGVPRFGLSRSSLRLKRAFDVLMAGSALLILSPFLLAVAIAITLDSPGGVLFRQTRAGRGGRRFEILKFRSMVADAEAMKPDLLELNEASEGLFKIAADPRITRVGRHLRSTHLDELPQLVNVLRGEMSLVGPRPLVPEEDARVQGRDRLRVHLTPGLTGAWQVRGPMSTPLSEMAKLDYVYASNWSIWEDVDIVLKTVVRVLTRSGH